MAQIVSGIGCDPRSVYPWDEWLDGQARMLLQGEDFRTNSDSFRTYAYNTAKKRGVKIVTRITTDDSGRTALILQARL